jgi:L-ascorbate metabolism protein UlaG (beta-lactamase superfamily)
VNTKRILQIVAPTIFALFLGHALSAQQPLLQYWRNPDGMLQDQASVLFEQAHKVLDSHIPSASGNSDERKIALYTIDALVHDNRLDNTKAFLDYINKRYDVIAAKLKNEKPNNKEIRIYKLYNHGYVLQTPTVTIAIDMIRGGGAAKPFVSEPLIQSIVDQCDILFISHAHGDHADKSVVRMFCDQQKKVIAPPKVFENTSPYITHIRGEEVKTEKIAMPAKKVELNVKVFPGHQEEVLNNMYAITTPEGITALHTGDQDSNTDKKMVADIGNKAKVDVLLVHSWMEDIEDAVAGIRPTLIISGHENELEHSIDHRESYWLTFKRFANLTTPFIVMAWGEYFTFSQK